MELYRINLTGFGLEDDKLFNAQECDLEIVRKGDVWNKRTGKFYDENIISLLWLTTYEKGFGESLSEIINLLENTPGMKSLFSACQEVELQIRISLNDENDIPSLHFSVEQLGYLSAIRAEMDIDIS